MTAWKQHSSRRDKLSIIAEILEITKEGALKTQIMFNASLSFPQLNDYIKFMLKTGLINKFRANGKDVYEATEKGLDFLQRHYELTELIADSSNSDNLHESNALLRIRQRKE
jgi:predicted transcriptional regulator